MTKKKGFIPFTGRVKRCVTCKQVKTITEFSNAAHQSCSNCISFTHGGKAPASSNAQESARHWAARGIYDGAELRPFEGRSGAMDAYGLPSRGAFL